jgi:hypothetical protein
MSSAERKITKQELPALTEARKYWEELLGSGQIQIIHPSEATSIDPEISILAIEGMNSEHPSLTLSFRSSFFRYMGTDQLGNPIFKIDTHYACTQQPAHDGEKWVIPTAYHEGDGSMQVYTRHPEEIAYFFPDTKPASYAVDSETPRTYPALIIEPAKSAATKILDLSAN